MSDPEKYDEAFRRMESAVLRSPNYYQKISFSKQLVKFYKQVKLVQEGGSVPEGAELARWLVMAIQLRARAFTFSYLYLHKEGSFPMETLQDRETDLLSLFSYDSLDQFKECEKIEMIFNEILGPFAKKNESPEYEVLAGRLVMHFVR